MGILILNWTYKAFKMQSKSLLKLGSRTIQLMQRRGKAVQNYKRPSMDEYPVPVEAFETGQGRTNKKYNMILAAGLSVAIPTAVFCYYSDKTIFFTVPRDIIEQRDDYKLPKENYKPKFKKLKRVDTSPSIPIFSIHMNSHQNGRQQASNSDNNVARRVNVSQVPNSVSVLVPAQMAAAVDAVVDQGEHH